VRLPLGSWRSRGIVSWRLAAALARYLRGRRGPDDCAHEHRFRPRHSYRACYGHIRQSRHELPRARVHLAARRGQDDGRPDHADTARYLIAFTYGMLTVSGALFFTQLFRPWAVHLDLLWPHDAHGGDCPADLESPRSEAASKRGRRSLRAHSSAQGRAGRLAEAGSKMCQERDLCHTARTLVHCATARKFRRYASVLLREVRCFARRFHYEAHACGALVSEPRHGEPTRKTVYLALMVVRPVHTVHRARHSCCSGRQ
jgi:hypothetical protein